MSLEKQLGKLKAEKANIASLWLSKRHQQNKTNKTFDLAKYMGLEAECKQLSDKYAYVLKQITPLQKYVNNSKFLQGKQDQMDALMNRLRHLEGKRAQEEFFSARWKAYGHDIKQVQEGIALIDQELQKFIQENNTECIITN